MIEFRKITSDNFDECIHLEPREDQKNFVASNVYSLAESYVAAANNEGIPMPYAIYADEQMVGFILMVYNQPDEYYDTPVYWVCRLMIDKHFQGRGYGKEAMLQAIELIKTFPHGSSPLISLSYEPDNLVAKSLYASLGFQETGQLIEGELVAVLPLE
jgi:diamine N-acetyltransferase